MANAKELKDRIRSVGDTRKITNAMYLIASMKMRKAKAELDGTRPYFEAIRGEIKRIFRTVQDVQSQYFYPDSGEPPLHGPYACLVITADKGLAGMYNQNVIKKAARQPAIRYRWNGAFSTPRRIPPCSVPARSARYCWSCSAVALRRKYSYSIQT